MANEKQDQQVDSDLVSVSVRMPKAMKAELTKYAAAVPGCNMSKLIVTALADKLGMTQMIDPWS